MCLAWVLLTPVTRMSGTLSVACCIPQTLMAVLGASDFVRLFKGMQYQTRSQQLWLLAGWLLGATCYALGLSEGFGGFLVSGK